MIHPLRRKTTIKVNRLKFRNKTILESIINGGDVSWRDEKPPKNKRSGDNVA